MAYIDGLHGYEDLESPNMGRWEELARSFNHKLFSSPKFSGSPKFSQDTITCNSDGMKNGGGHVEQYIKGEQTIHSH